MSYRIIILSLFIAITFTQTQVVIVEEMLMDVPFAVEIKYTTTKYASDNLFKRDMEIEVGSFLVRIAMGGNKKLGEFIDGNKKMRTVYDLNEEEYAQENFQTIIDNDGKPTLEIPLGGPMGGGGGGNSNNEDDQQNEDDEEQVDEDEQNNEVRRVIEKGYEKIGEFSGIVKLSKKASKIFLDKYSELKNSHQGKFHNAPSLEKAIIPDMLQELIDSEINVEPILISGKWCEIDTPKDLERARKIF